MTRARFTSLAAAFGGSLWVLWLALAATRPELPWYCVRCGEEVIVGRAILFTAALAGIAVAALGLAVEERARLGRSGVASAAVVAGGAALLVLGLPASLVVEALWMVVFFAEIATIAGCVALAAAALRANVLTPGPAALLLVGALGLALVNFGESVTPLLAVPFGAAWVWVGQTVWARSG